MMMMTTTMMILALAYGDDSCTLSFACIASLSLVPLSIVCLCKPTFESLQVADLPIFGQLKMTFQLIPAITMSNSAALCGR